MIKIDVINPEVKTKTGTSQKGRPYTLQSQVAYAYLPDKAFPVEISITLQGDKVPYPKGSYQLDPASLTVGSYGRLEIGNIVLKPLVKAA